MLEILNRLFKTAEDNALKVLPWILVAFLGVFILVDRQSKESEPAPVPVITVEQAASGVIHTTAKGYAAAFETAAQKVDSKEIGTDAELLKYLAPKNKEIRDAAVAEFNAVIEEQLPNVPWVDDAAQRDIVAKVLTEAAKGFGSAVP